MSPFLVTDSDYSHARLVKLFARISTAWLSSFDTLDAYYILIFHELTFVELTGCLLALHFLLSSCYGFTTMHTRAIVLQMAVQDEHILMQDDHLLPNISHHLSRTIITQWFTSLSSSLHVVSLVLLLRKCEISEP